MRKIINGKAYDTEKATTVAERDNGQWDNRFNLVTETLYRKRTGEYFLHGEGGAMTRYAQSCGQNSWSGGELITPLSYDQAKQWCEDNGTAEEYEREFGVIEDDAETTAALHVVISKTAWLAIQRKAAQEGKTLRAVVEEMAAAI